MLVTPTATFLEVERELRDYDLPGRRERRELVAKVHRLTALGVTAEDIAPRVGIVPRNVTRARSQPFPEQPPMLPDSRTVSEARCRELEDVALLAGELSVRLRDENPMIVWKTLCRLNDQQLRELVVAALAMVPVDVSVSSLLGWVEELA